MESEIIKGLAGYGVLGFILALMILALWKTGRFLASEVAVPLTKAALEHMKMQEATTKGIKDAVEKLAQKIEETHKDSVEADHEIILGIDRIEDRIKGDRGQ